MHLLGRPSFIADLRLPAPSPTTLLLSFLFSLSLLAVIRLTFIALSSLSKVSDAKEKLHAVHAIHYRWLPTLGIPIRKWSWKRAGLPLSLPASFTGHEITNDGKGKAAGLTTAPTPPITTNLQTKCVGPAFEHPLPAIYETEVPVSMAKMIMSRHTSRRPMPARPPRRVTVSAPRRVQSMV